MLHPMCEGVPEVRLPPQESGCLSDTSGTPEEAARDPLTGSSSGWRNRVGGRGTAVHRILIVEGSETMRSMLMATLEDLAGPVKADTASSGFEALRLLPREQYDLIVTDINMPDINGLELVSFVKRNDRYESIPVIIVSTEGSERDRDKGLALGAAAYIVKPFDPEELLEVAADLLARAEQGA